MTKFVRTFLSDESGATAVEYGLLVALIAVVIASTVVALGINLEAMFLKISNCVKDPSVANCP